MIRWPQPEGQGEEFARLLGQARQLRMHHGVLLTGGRGVGKTMAAHCLAQALLCPADNPDQACGVCPACVHIDNHPDLHRVQIPEDKEEIPVDLVRELRQSLQRLPVEGRARVVLVDPADRLNIQGQNALLKTLEEPGRRTFLLLPTRRPEGLLETVRSRVSELRLRPLVADRVDALLAQEGIDAATRSWAVAHADGSVGWAFELAEGDFRPLFGEIEAFVAGQGSPVSTARSCLEGVSGRLSTVDRARLVLWMVRTILRKELLASLASADSGAYVPEQSARCATQIETLFDAESDLIQRIPPEQVLTHAFIKVRSEGR